MTLDSNNAHLLQIIANLWKSLALVMQPFNLSCMGTVSSKDPHKVNKIYEVYTEELGAGIFSFFAWIFSRYGLEVSILIQPPGEFALAFSGFSVIGGRAEGEINHHLGAKLKITPLG